MRKISTTLLVALIITTSVSAQHKKWGHFGIKTGFNLTTIDVKDGLPPNTKSEWKSGFVFGVNTDIPVSAKLSVEPNFLYSSMGGNFTTNSQTTNYRINYFSIPVLLKYNICKHFKVEAGPQGDFIIQAKTNDGEKITSAFNEFNFLGTAGGEFWFNNAFGLGARYMYSFTNALTNSSDKWTNHGVQVTATFRLN